MASLLGQFFTRINGSQEDIASEGIVYILQSSKNARDSIIKLLFNLTGLNFNDINYISQSVGKNKERPDISGFDNEGKEVVIMEAKFWASLTDNQPNEYLKRLSSNTILLFICPSLRKISLSNEIEYKMKERGIKFSVKDNNFITEENKYLIIIDWKTILENIKIALLNNNENILVSDIDQLIGYCEIIDNNTFMPIQDSDLSPEIPKRINSYIDIIDKTLQKLIAENGASTDNGKLRSAGNRYGYVRYFTLNNYCMEFEINYLFWQKYSDTPFWITIKTEWNKPQPIELKNKLKNISIRTNIKIFENSINDSLYYALKPELNEIEDIVISNLINKILTIISELNKL